MHLFNVIHHGERTAFPHLAVNKAEAIAFGPGNHGKEAIFGDGTLWPVIPRYLGEQKEAPIISTDIKVSFSETCLTDILADRTRPEWEPDPSRYLSLYWIGRA